MEHGIFAILPYPSSVYRENGTLWNMVIWCAKCPILLFSRPD